MRTSRVPLATRLGALALITGTTACLGTDVIEPVPIEETEFATELGIDLDAMTITATGLYYLDETVGDGVVAEYGDVITVDYSGWLSDGRLFDSSKDGGRGPLLIDGIEGNEHADPQLRTYGWNHIIPGWREGLLGMRVGGTRLLVIPYNLAYGASGLRSVPPYANLVFRIELLTNASPE